MKTPTKKITTRKVAPRKVRARKAPSKGLGSLTQKETARAVSKVASRTPIIGYCNLLERGGKTPGFNNLATQPHQSAYTLGSMVHLGLATVKGSDVSKGKGVQSKGVLQSFLSGAVGYWKTQGWLSEGPKGMTLTVQGVNTLSARLKGQAPRKAFNTNPEALKGVLAWISKGKGPKGIGFNPKAVKRA